MARPKKIQDKMSLRDLSKLCGNTHHSNIDFQRQKGLSDEEIIKHFAELHEFQENTVDLKTEKLKLEVENKRLANDKLKIQNKRALDELIDIDLVKSLCVEIASVIKISQSQAIQSLPYSLLGKEIADINDLLKKEFEKMNKYTGEEIDKRIKKLSNNIE